MKNVLLINGSPNEHGCTDVALQEVADTLEKNGVESEILWLGKSPCRTALPALNVRRPASAYSGMPWLMSHSVWMNSVG